MSIIIGASIDLAKVDRSKIIEGKNGAKYYPITIMVNDTVGDYGHDVSITEEQSKEQRDAKEKKVYIGNGKTVWANNVPIAKDKQKYGDQPAQNEQFSQSSAPQVNEDLPF